MVTIQRLYSRSNRPQAGEVDHFITVKNDFIGFHAYENAPDQVAFLKNRHRHKFYAESSIQVFHDDRELEFFMVQELIERDILPFLSLTPLGSCEQTAEDIMWGLINSYGTHRYYQVDISEDNENSATVRWTPKGLFHESN